MNAAHAETHCCPRAAGGAALSRLASAGKADNAGRKKADAPPRPDRLQGLLRAHELRTNAGGSVADGSGRLFSHPVAWLQRSHAWAAASADRAGARPGFAATLPGMRQEKGHHVS